MSDYETFKDEDACPHEVKELRHRFSGNQYIMQCQKCGHTSSAISHSTLTAEQRKAAPEIDESIKVNYYEARRKRYIEWQDERMKNGQLERQKSKRQWLVEHSAYLKSPKWKSKREAVLRRDGYICKACESRQATQVHHLTYQHWRDEPLFELVAVCKPCHEKITTMDNGGNSSPSQADHVLYRELDY